MTADTWPNGAKIAVAFNVAYEAWTPGKAPGISPMGNPLPAGLLDTQALSWGGYGPRTGIWRLLRVLDRAQVTATFMVSGILAEHAPESVVAIARAGHEICGHGWTQDALNVSLDRDAERDQIRRLSARPGGGAGRARAPRRHRAHPPRRAGRLGGCLRADAGAGGGACRPGFRPAVSSRTPPRSDHGESEAPATTAGETHQVAKHFKELVVRIGNFADGMAPQGAFGISDGQRVLFGEALLKAAARVGVERASKA